MRFTYPKLTLILAETFSALRYPNYRLWFFGQLVSLFGTWMQMTAQGYLVYQLTNSPAYLGYVGFALGSPSWFFMLYGGVIADRVRRRDLILVTQFSMMSLAIILAGLTFSGLVQPWHIVTLAFLLGIANAFDAPARQAFLLELVNRDDLSNAIALNSSMFNMATALGPAVGGLTYSLFGPAWCFTINGLTFTAVIAALLMMKIKHNPTRIKKNSILFDLQEGLRFTASHHLIRMVILNMAVLSLFGLGMITLMPAWAVNILGGDASTNGLLLSARGVGALVGALMIASLGRYRVRGRFMAAGSFILPVLMLVFASVRILPLSLIILVGIGWGLMVLFNTSNALVQLHVPDQLRGRVMGIFTLTFFGMMPIGSMVSGQLAARFGEPATLTLSGLVLLIFSVIFWSRMPDLKKV